MDKVSVIIPTYNRCDLLTQRALPSVLRQTHSDLEVLVVGDGTDRATVKAMTNYPDERVSFINLPHFRYPRNQNKRWGLAALTARNWGLDHATGQYIAMLDDDDEMLPNAIALLLGFLKQFDVDFLYGISETFKGDPPVMTGQRYGAWPPGDGQFCVGSFVYKASLNYRFALDCYERRNVAGDADMWTRMYEDGVKFSIINHVVHHYYRNYP